MTRILVAGYFDHFNLGDDLFYHVWQSLFSMQKFNKNSPEFISLERIDEYDLCAYSMIILAGGDILNYYFLVKLKTHLNKCGFKGKICAFSVGIPYDTVIIDGLLDQFHFLMCRSTKDATMLRKRFGESHVRYFPDLSVYLPKLYDNIVKPKKEADGIRPWKLFPERLNVGVFLTRNIFEKNENYDKVITGLSNALSKIAGLELPGSPGFELFLIPFCTNEKNIFEDDNLINTDVVDRLRGTDSSIYVHNVDKRFSVEEMYFIFKDQLDVCLTMRYHSHMFATICRVPFVSLYTTQKVHNLLCDLELSSYGYRLPVNDHDMPKDFLVEEFIDKFITSFNDREIIRQKEGKYMTISFDSFEETLGTLLDCPVDQVFVRQRSFPMNTVMDVIESIVRYIWKHTLRSFVDKDVAYVADSIYKNKIKFSMLIPSEYSQKDIVKLADFVAALACFGLIHIPYPKYHFGMAEKILQNNFAAKNEFLWVWKDHQNGNDRFFIQNPVIRRPLFNATFVGVEDFKGCHRSGWQYCLDHLMSFHSEKAPLIFDNYIDRTFHWAHDIYKYTGIIPFKSPWCGFIHHTFDEEYSPFNVPNLFRNETFLESLKHCHALFTLSEDLALKILVLLKQYGFGKVLVKSFTHPTETSKQLFTMEKFLANENKKVVQIGAWLRDTFAIYKLHPHKKSAKSRSSSSTKRLHLQKAVLKGKNMNNYFKPENMKLVVKNVPLVEDENGNVPDEFTYDFGENKLVNFTSNKFVLGLIQSIHDAWRSVEVLDTLNNTNYDKLLSENIVFLKLVDASAVNTIIECIVRGTPVLVNRLPAVEEMLTADYPFYYDDLTEAGYKVNDLDLIRKTSRFLTTMSKKRFTMDYFMDEVDQFLAEHPVV